MLWWQLNGEPTCTNTLFAHVVVQLQLALCGGGGVSMF